MQRRKTAIPGDKSFRNSCSYNDLQSEILPGGFRDQSPTNYNHRVCSFQSASDGVAAMRTHLLDRSDARGTTTMAPETPGRMGRMVDAAHFGDLLISHRRMERLVYPEHRLRGLRDLETGEVFLIDERRLFDARH